MKFLLFQLLPVTAIFLAFLNIGVHAQIVPDTSLGNESSAIGSAQTDTGIQVITGGAARGSSLFHSFEQFSVDAGQKVYFGNPSEVSNIFTRVTGNQVSNISGTLGVLGSANLFFLNPSGIIFTKGASLDLRGSFLATTANSFSFADGSSFSATNPQSAPLLTINLPLGLNFSGNPGVIQVLDTPQTQSQLPIVGTFPTVNTIDGKPTGLTVNPSKTLALVGGAVTFASGIATAPMGRIEVGALDQGTVRVEPDPKGFTLDYGKVIAFDDIELTRFSLLDANGFSGNQIRLQGRRITLSNGSFLAVRNTGNQADDSAIVVNATEAVNVIGFKANPIFSLQYSGQTTNAVIWSYAVAGKGADIFVSTPNLNLETAGIVLSTAFAGGTAGRISIEASNLVNAKGFLHEVLKPGQLPSKFSAIASIAYGSGSRTGDILVGTKKLLLEDLGSVGTFSFESATAGNLSINASDLIELKGSDPASGYGTRLVSTTSGEGNAGNLQISTKQLQVLDGGTVGSSTISNGSAKDVTINADLVKVSGTIPGTINRSRIISAAQLQDPKLRQTLGLPVLGVGNAKNLHIETDQLLVDSGGEISVQNDGDGSAGTLSIAANSIRLTNQSSISGSVGSGDGGNIVISVKDLLLLQNHSDVSAFATGAANGGNIAINTGTLAVLEKSKISADAVQGRGGNIQINTQGLFRSPDSTITASSQLGINGTVQINNLFNDPNSGLIELPQELIDPTGLIVQGCPGNVGPHGSSFVITGRGGLPEDPYAPLNAEAPVWIDLRPVDSNQNQQNKPVNSEDMLRQSKVKNSVNLEPNQLIAANSWHYNSQGEVVLTASTPSAPSLLSLQCHVLDHLGN